MTLSALKSHLKDSSHRKLRFLLPDGALVAAHAHVTEVARVEKHFMDCGGTLRAEVLCRLQTWVADDFEHRLTAGKLLGILDKAGPLLKGDDFEVDIEHELAFITQFPLSSVEIAGDEIYLGLTLRHTACLAQDKCLPGPASPQAISFKPFIRKS